MDCYLCEHARDSHSGGDVVLGNCWVADCPCRGDEDAEAIQFYEDFYLALKGARELREARAAICNCGEGHSINGHAATCPVRSGETCPGCGVLTNQHWNFCSYYRARTTQ